MGARDLSHAAAVVAVCLSACGSPAGFVRPQGDGGWDTARRGRELERLARRAGVDLAVEAEASPHAPQPIDLAAALAMAAKGNRTTLQSERQLEISAEAVRNTRGRLLPGAVASGRYTWFSDAQRNRVHFPPGVFGDSGSPAIEIRDAELGNVNGTITLPLDLSGELRHTLTAAQAGYRGEQARLWATTLEQQLGVVRAYFALLEAKRLREVTDQRVALYRQQLANAESKFRSGRLTKNQLLVVQVALQVAVEESRQRDLAIAQGRYSMNQAIGADVDAPTEPVDVTERPIVPPVAEALRVAYADNPLLRGLLEEQQRIEETERSLERSRFPRLSAGGAVDYSSSKLLDPREISSGFVGFSWDLGIDGRREADIAEARIAAEKNRLEIERQLRQLEALVRFTRDAGDERVAALAAAETAVGQAEENLRIRQQQFDAGRASSEDVLDAEALLSSQRAVRASALYQAHIRVAELASLMGRSPSPHSR